jgi:hypothetical protein
LYNISSAITLPLKIFLPTFWLTFFGMFMLVTLFSVDEEMFAGMPTLWFRIGITLFWASGLVLFYFTIFRLKRLDADQEYMFVSSYFKNIRYPINDIESISTYRFAGIIGVGTLELKGEGSFGKRMTFLPSISRMRRFKEAYPEWAEKMQ